MVVEDDFTPQEVWDELRRLKKASGKIEISEVFLTGWLSCFGKMDVAFSKLMASCARRNWQQHLNLQAMMYFAERNMNLPFKVSTKCSDHYAAIVDSKKKLKPNLKSRFLKYFVVKPGKLMELLITPEILSLLIIVLMIFGIWQVAVELMFIVILGILISQALKKYFWRFRPFMTLYGNDAFALAPFIDKPATSSFPSRAVTLAVPAGYFVAIFAAGNASYPTVLGYSLLAIIPAALQRTFVQAHFLSDCFFGALLGTAISVVGHVIYANVQEFNGIFAERLAKSQTLREMISMIDTLEWVALSITLVVGCLIVWFLIYPRFIEVTPFILPYQKEIKQNHKTAVLKKLSSTDDGQSDEGKPLLNEGPIDNESLKLENKFVVEEYFDKMEVVAPPLFVAFTFFVLFGCDVYYYASRGLPTTNTNHYRWSATEVQIAELTRVFTPLLSQPSKSDWIKIISAAAAVVLCSGIGQLAVQRRLLSNMKKKFARQGNDKKNCANTTRWYMAIRVFYFVIQYIICAAAMYWSFTVHLSLVAQNN